MFPEGIGVSTITLAHSPHEEKQIIDSLGLLSKLDLPVVVCDGGSPDSFLNQVKKINGVIITPQPSGGLLNQVRESLNRAAGIYPYVFYTESNKFAFFNDQLSFFLDEANKIIKRSHPGVIVTSRSPESFSTYPPFQRQTETFINMLLAEFLGATELVDYSYGPRIIDSGLIPYLNQVTTDFGWGWMSYIVLMAKKINKEIKTVNFNLPCPKNEQGETEKDKIFRLRQFNNHISAILEAN